MSDNEMLIVAREKIGRALGRYADCWDETEGGIVTAFIAIAEVATPDGQKGLIQVKSEDLTAWVRDGLLFHALHDDWFRSTPKTLDDGDDDDD